MEYTKNEILEWKEKANKYDKFIDSKIHTRSHFIYTRIKNRNEINEILKSLTLKNNIDYELILIKYNSGGFFSSSYSTYTIIAHGGLYDLTDFFDSITKIFDEH